MEHISPTLIKLIPHSIEVNPPGKYMVSDHYLSFLIKNVLNENQRSIKNLKDLILMHIGQLNNNFLNKDELVGDFNNSFNRIIFEFYLNKSFNLEKIYPIKIEDFKNKQEVKKIIYNAIKENGLDALSIYNKTYKKKIGIDFDLNEFVLQLLQDSSMLDKSKIIALKILKENNKKINYNTINQNLIVKEFIKVPILKIDFLNNLDKESIILNKVALDNISIKYSFDLSDRSSVNAWDLLWITKLQDDLRLDVKIENNKNIVQKKIEDINQLRTNWQIDSMLLFLNKNKVENQFNRVINDLEDVLNNRRKHITYVGLIDSLEEKNTVPSRNKFKI